MENKNMLSGYVTNLNKYNNGKGLIGEWVEFPTTKEHIKEVFKRIGCDRGDEYFVTAYDSEYPVVYAGLGEYTYLNGLNYYASLLAEADDRNKALALLKAHGGFGLNRNIEILLGEDSYYYSPATNEEELADEYIEELEITGKADAIPEAIMANIDRKNLGNYLKTSDSGVLTEYGYVCGGSEGSFERIPEEYWVI